MNIFYTDSDPKKCAANHCKVHVRKMIVEYAQLLSTAHHVIDGEYAIEGIYKKTHENHPCAIWVRQSTAHYYWLYDLLEALCDIYEANTGKTHKTAEKLKILLEAPFGLRPKPFVEPPQCMPELYMCKDTITAYKTYLFHKYMEWQSREKPIKVEFYC